MQYYVFGTQSVNVDIQIFHVDGLEFVFCDACNNFAVWNVVSMTAPFDRSKFSKASSIAHFNIYRSRSCVYIRLTP